MKDGFSRRTFLKRFGLGSLVLFETSKVLGDYLTIINPKDSDNLILPEKKVDLTTENLKFTEEYLKKISDKELKLIYMTGGNYPPYGIEAKNRKEMIEKILES